MGGKKACIYFIDGMVKDESVQKLLQYFFGLKAENMPEDIHGILKKFMPYGEVDLIESTDEAVRNILSGVPCLIVEDYSKVISIDARTYPARGVEEPEKDKVMRGSRDGFVETLVFNTALIRRRIRDPRLTMYITEAGRVSHTDIVLCYMEDRVEKKFLEEIKRRISNISVESLTMNQESLAECLYHGKWYNPFPKFKFSERPDTAAAAILEGDIIILVDNSPAAMILPTTIFDIVEEADDYYFPPVTGTYLRMTRFITNFLALFLTPTFLLFMQHPEWLSERWQFIAVKEVMNIPLVLQFLILEFALDGLRLASLNTPSMLSLPLSVIAGVIIGDFTVESGWFNSEAMLYMSFVAIANYTQVSLELGYALKFMRIILLLLTQFFGLWGFIAGTILDILAICCNKTIGGRSYLYPLVPLKPKQLLQRVFRVTLPYSENQK
ncbi:MAG: spore germination protein [Lachnospiraceae bacterium]|nr:spore germination protein [Lachnospiraceae bacterium]